MIFFFIFSSLKKSRLNALSKGKNIICTIPAYRFDIFGPMDLVEEVALGYGIQNFEPTMSPSQTIGHTNPISLQLKSLNQTMIGLGFLEALNSSLSSKRVLYDMTNRDSKNIISVLVNNGPSIMAILLKSPPINPFARSKLEYVLPLPALPCSANLIFAFFLSDFRISIINILNVSK